MAGEVLVDQANKKNLGNAGLFASTYRSLNPDVQCEDHVDEGRPQLHITVLSTFVFTYQ